jgi:hypothetical protein
VEKGDELIFVPVRVKNKCVPFLFLQLEKLEMSDQNYEHDSYSSPTCFFGA